jgi:2-oxoglutarate ferredoxin oxidoreductase subunit delta
MTPITAPVTQSRAAPTGRRPIVERPAPVRGVVFLKKGHCKGCELCIEFCPKNVLARSKDFNVKGYHYPVVTNGDCINCRLCVTVCPEFAIFSVPAAAAVRVKASMTVVTNNGGRA